MEDLAAAHPDGLVSRQGRGGVATRGLSALVDGPPWGKAVALQRTSARWGLR
jgi:hypothetical protein